MSGTWNGTGIRWTDEVWNPVHGCSKSGSPGCANCYAERVSRRYNHTPKPWLPANAEDNVQVKPYKLDELESLPSPCWVFVNSMSDLFHPLVDDEFVHRALAKMSEQQTSAFQILTKHGGDNERDLMPMPRNVMLGVSVGHPDWRYRIDWLREQQARTKFVSFEPLVHPIPEVDLSGIDWAIIGGESGPNGRRRDMDPAWARELIDACRAQDVAVFFKQHSGGQPESKVTIDLGDGPVRIEEFPPLPDGVAPSPREFRETPKAADGGFVEGGDA